MMSKVFKLGRSTQLSYYGDNLYISWCFSNSLNPFPPPYSNYCRHGGRFLKSLRSSVLWSPILDALASTPRIFVRGNMGILRIVLAVLGTLQVVIAMLYFDKGYHKQQITLLFSDSVGSEEAVAMLMELQSPFYFAMGAMNILSWKMGSHIRLQLAAVDIICLLGVSAIHYRHARHYTFPPLTTPVCVALLGLVAISVGLIFHKLKPGFLTEEKKAADKES